MDKVIVPSPHLRAMSMLALEVLEGRELRANKALAIGDDGKSFVLNRHAAIALISGQQYASYANALALFYIAVHKAQTPDHEKVLGQLSGCMTQLTRLHTLYIHSQQIFDEYCSQHPALAEKSYYEKERSGETNILADMLLPVRESILVGLKDKKPVCIPAGSQKHNVIIQIQKVNDNEFSITEFNAGYGARLAGQWVATSEDSTRTKEGVFGKRTWTISGDDAATKLATVIDLCLQRDLHQHYDYGHIQSKLERALGQPNSQNVVHVQDEPNCSTRTCREFIRGNLDASIFNQFMNYIHQQNEGLGNARLGGLFNMPDTYLTSNFCEALTLLSAALGVGGVAASVAVGNEGWSLHFPEKTDPKLRSMFGDAGAPNSAFSVSVSTESLQQLFDDLVAQKDVVQSFECFAYANREKPARAANHAETLMAKWSQYSDLSPAWYR